MTTATQTVFPQADTVHVMVYLDWFDLSGENDDERSFDIPALNQAIARIDLETQLAFPNATVFIATDVSDYAQFHSRVCIWNDHTGVMTANADEVLHDIVESACFN